MTDEIMQRYSFSYTDLDGKEYIKTIKTPGVTWYECLDDYVKFLESVFGYALMDKVRLREPAWLDMMHEHDPYYDDPWTGGYFADEDIDPEDNW
jgi:hypothetical protein